MAADSQFRFPRTRSKGKALRSKETSKVPTIMIAQSSRDYFSIRLVIAARNCYATLEFIRCHPYFMERDLDVIVRSDNKERWRIRRQANTDPGCKDILIFTIGNPITRISFSFQIRIDTILSFKTILNSIDESVKHKNVRISIFDHSESRCPIIIFVSRSTNMRCSVYAEPETVKFTQK